MRYRIALALAAGSILASGLMLLACALSALLMAAR